MDCISDAPAVEKKPRPDESDIMAITEDEDTLYAKAFEKCLTELAAEVYVIHEPFEIAQRTFDEILKNPKATLSELSEKLEISDRTVKNHIALLKEANVIERVGGKTYGYWKVLLSDGEK